MKTQIKDIQHFIAKSFFLFFLLISNLCEARIIFVHIPKTGGTSILELLKNNFNNSQIYPFGKIDQKILHGVWDQEGATKKQMKEAFRVLPNINQELAWGHFPMWFFQKKDPNYATTYFFTVLRDPVERVLSHDRYRVREDRKKGQDVSLDPLKIPANFMCKVLCSDPTLRGDELLKDCIKNLHRMNFIVFMDDFENGVKALFKELGLRLPESIPHKNVTEAEEVSDEMIKKIKAYNALDVQLYEYALKNFR